MERMSPNCNVNTRPFGIFILDNDENLPICRRSEQSINQTPMSDDIFENIITTPINSTSATIKEPLNFVNSTVTSKSFIVPDLKSKHTLESMLMAEEFESGVANPSETYFRKIFKEDRIFAINCISSVFMDNFSAEGRKISILVGALHAISHFKYDDVYPLGQYMALTALSHKNNEVSEFGVKCFENWEHPDGVEKLKTVSFSAKWLQDYAQQVINELSEGD